VMEHRIIARGLLSFVCASQGVATLAIDLNRTHATNPLWVKHARFHVVWQTISVFILSAIEVALVWWPGHWIEQRFYLAMILAGVPMLGFLAAFAFRKAYGGALSDPNGIPPLRIAIAGKILRVDLNLAAELVALIALGAIFAIYRL
jgi:hypothetical protein